MPKKGERMKREIESLLGKDMGFDSKKVLASRRSRNKNGVVVANSRGILSEIARGDA